MLKLTLQYSDHLMWRANSLEKTLMLGKIEGRQEEKGMTENEMVGWHHRLSEHEFEQTPGDSERRPGVRQSMGSPSVRQDWGTEQLSPRRYSMKPALWTKSLVQPLASPLVFLPEKSPQGGRPVRQMNLLVLFHPSKIEYPHDSMGIAQNTEYPYFSFLWASTSHS